MKSGILKILSLLIALGLYLVPSVLAETPEEKGLRLMTQMDNAPIFERFFSNTYLEIYNKQNKKIFTKKTRVGTYWENFRDPKKRLNRSIAYFYSPADDKSNASLILEHADKEDEQWVYLKGLNKPKRIIASDKSSSFMGSDFSYGDISPRKLDDFTYRWLGKEKVSFKGKKLNMDKIEVLFKSEKESRNYGYKKFILYVVPKYGIPFFKIEIYNMSDQLYKVAFLRSVIMKKNVDGKKVFLPTSIEMKNLLEGTRTVMTMPSKSIKVEKKASKLKPAIFKVKYLTRRWW